MLHKKRKKYTVMFIPDDNGRPFSFKVGVSILRLGLIFLFIFFAGIAVLLARAGDIAVRLQLLSALREENIRLKEQNAKLINISEKVQSMERLSVYLRRIATITGEGSDVMTLPDDATVSSDGIFGKDSIDNQLDEIRLSGLDAYKELSEAEGTPELLLTSIPNIRPVDGWVTKTFVESRRAETEQHLGVDFAASQGTLIRATSPGTVEVVKEDKYFGLLVIIQHNFGFETRYGHCIRALVAQNEIVERGQAIALVGNAGTSSGPHLHYEVLRNGKHVDPVKYMLSNTVLP